MNKTNPKLFPQGMKDEDWDLILGRVNEGKCTPFIGAGACWPYLPLGSQIAQELAMKYNYPLPDMENLPIVAQFISITRRDSIFPKERVRDILKKKNPTDFSKCELPHLVLADLPLSIYLTTNYDDFMVRALQMKGKDAKSEYCRWNRYISKEPDRIKEDFIPSINTPLVYHLHGTWDVPESLVLTEDDYLDFLVNVTENKDQSLHHRISRSMTGTSLIFIGYRLDDLSFRTIFRGLINSPEKSLRRTSISVQIPPADEQLQSLKRSIQRLDAFIKKLILLDKDKDEIIQLMAKLNNTIIDAPISNLEKDQIYSEINVLENKLYNLPLESNAKKILVSVINLLQDSIGLLPTKDEKNNQEEAIKYLEKYYNEMDIRIYWGTAHQFTEELNERWGEYKRSI